MSVTLGVHLARGGVRAAVVDGDGHVRASAAGSADLASVVLDTMPQAPGVAPPAAVGLAVDALDAADHGPVRNTLSRFGRVETVGAGVAAVMAEAWIGAGTGLRHVVCLWIGEEVLAGLLFDGRPWSGAHGLAGAAAWLALNPVERQDYRRFGCLEAEVSTQGIARRLAWRIQTGDESAALGAAGALEAMTATHVFDAARQGDGVAISVVRDTARYIGMAAANLASAIDPEVVVIAGPVAAAGDLLIEPVRQEAARRLAPALATRFRCEVSPLGEDGIAIGAARLAALARA
jgi:predicted NBD/HSP70 family sugar kinase